MMYWNFKNVLPSNILPIKVLYMYMNMFHPLQALYLGDKRTLLGLFRNVYRGFTAGNRVFLATRSQENVSFQQ